MTLGNTSVNEIFLNYISNQSGVSFGDSLLFWMFGLVIAMIIYLLLNSFTDFSKSVIIILAIMPTILLDLIISFGTYEFVLPFIGIYEIHNLVMTFSITDWVFGFQLFNPAKDIMALYTTNVVATSILVKLMAFVLSLGDSIFQIILFSLTFYYIISLIEFKFNMEFEWQRVVSFVCGLVPVSIYALFFSNPFHEYEMANEQASNLVYFFNNAQSAEITFVILTGFIAFLLVFFIVSIITRFLLSAAISISPKMQEQLLMTSYASVAFLLTLLYAFLYVMHPDYKWYMIILVIIVWKLFRGVMEDISQEARVKTGERSVMNSQARTIVDMMTNEINTQGNGDNNDPLISHREKTEVTFKLEILVAMISIILILLGILIIMGIL